MTQDKRGNTRMRPLRVPVTEFDHLMIVQATIGHMAHMLFNLRLVALRHADEAIRAQAMALLVALNPYNRDIFALYEAVVEHTEGTAAEEREEQTVEQTDEENDDA